MKDDLLLSKEELQLLKSISRTGSIWLDDPRARTDECTALHRYGLVQTADLPCYPKKQQSIYSQINSFSISEAGRQYLRRVERDSFQNRMMWVRYLITTGIAVLALILSIISILL